MAEYEYTGPGPHPDRDGGIVRPGDVREFEQEPDWGPWRLLEDDPGEPELVIPPAVVITPDGPQKPAAPPAAPSPAPPAASPPAASPPPAPKQGE
jgi:hypothetical protein